MAMTNYSDDAFRSLFLRVLGVEPGVFRADLQIGDVEQWDSIAHLELVSELELGFGVQFATEDLMGLGSVAELQARVAELCESR